MRLWMCYSQPGQNFRQTNTDKLIMRNKHTNTIPGKKKRLKNWWCCVWVTKKVVGSKKWLSRQVWRLSLSPSPGHQRRSRHWSGSAIDDDKIRRYGMSGLTNLSLRKSPLSVPMLCNTTSTFFLTRSLRSMPLCHFHKTVVWPVWESAANKKPDYNK